jgi:hypothetical protein
MDKAAAESALRTVEWMRANPDLVAPSTWLHQLKWSCKTVGCFAGHHALLNGWELRPGFDSTVCHPETGHYQHVGDLVAEMLDLSLEEAEALFYGWQELDELERLIRRFSGEDD